MISTLKSFPVLCKNKSRSLYTKRKIPINNDQEISPTLSLEEKNIVKIKVSSVHKLPFKSCSLTCLCL